MVELEFFNYFLNYLKVAEIQRKHAQPIGSSEADSMTRDQARKLQLQVLDSKRNIGDLKARVNII